MSGSWRYLGQEPHGSKPLVPTQLPNPLSLGTAPVSPPEWVLPYWGPWTSLQWDWMSLGGLAVPLVVVSALPEWQKKEIWKLLAL